MISDSWLNLTKCEVNKYWFFCLPKPLSLCGWTSAFLLVVHRLCGAIEGRLSHFLPHRLWTGWQSVISQEKSPRNVPPWPGIEPGPDCEIHSFSHWAIMTRATKRADSEIHSFSHWAIMTRATERADSEIHSFSHWAIATDSLVLVNFYSGF